MLFAEIVCLVVQVVDDPVPLAAIVRCMQTSKQVAQAIRDDAAVLSIINRRLCYKRSVSWTVLCQRMRTSQSRCQECGRAAHTLACLSTSRTACVALCSECTQTSSYRRLISYKQAVRCTTGWRSIALQRWLAKDAVVARRGAPSFYNPTRYYWKHQVDALRNAV